MEMPIWPIVLRNQLRWYRLWLKLNLKKVEVAVANLAMKKWKRRFKTSLSRFYLLISKSLKLKKDLNLLKVQRLFLMLVKLFPWTFSCSKSCKDSNLFWVSYAQLWQTWCWQLMVKLSWLLKLFQRLKQLPISEFQGNGNSTQQVLKYHGWLLV